jgi:xanthine/CO dehydrogenase XdhC/CoxF family maturation factor
MNEFKTLVAAHDAFRTQRTPCVLATVVHVEGSSYRKAGARMLIGADGRMEGAISGGCLEGDARRKALLALHQNANKLVTYDTSDASDAFIGVQLGCNGVIQVLFEPLDTPTGDRAQKVLRHIGHLDDACVVVTLYAAEKNAKHPGTFWIYTPENDSRNHPEVPGEMVALAHRAFQQAQHQSDTIELEGVAYQALAAYCPPPIQLVLVGAGNDARVVANLAAILGWRVVVADGRPTHAHPSRFLPDCQLIIAKPEQALDPVNLNARTAVVLMTHNFPYDLSVLRYLLTHPMPPYVGLLGPQKRFLSMLEALDREGIRPTPQQRNQLYAPVGLDLGGEEAESIGLSIIAEIQQVFRRGRLGHLRDKNGPIHETKEPGESLIQHGG